MRNVFVETSGQKILRDARGVHESITYKWTLERVKWIQLAQDVGQ